MRTQQTYVNQDSANRINSVAGGEQGFNAGKVVFIAGKLEDSGYENVAFAGLEAGSLKPDLDNPLAKFNVVTADGVPHLEIKPFDHYGESLKAYEDAKARNNGNTVRAIKSLATAGIVNSQTIDATKSLNILDRVLGLQVRDFFLMNAVTMVPSPNLVFTVDEYTEGSVQEKMPELDEAQLISHAESRVTNVLYKNVGHIAISEEADMKGIHPTQQLRQDKTMKDLARAINSQIATELETATNTTAGSDWGSISGTPPDSDFNPIADIQPAITKIEGRGFNVDFIAGHDRPLTDLSTNKFIRGRGNVGIGTNVMQANIVNETGLPQLLKDQALTDTLAIVASKDACWLGQGATAVASYVNDQAGYKGWIAKQWWFPYIAQQGAIEVLTGVSA